MKPRFISHRIELTDEKFSEKYVVDAADATFVNSVLSSDLRDRLLQHAFDVQFGKRLGRRIGEEGWLTVSTGAIKEESYDNMIGVAIRFYERFLALDTARMREIQMD